MTATRTPTSETPASPLSVIGQRLAIAGLVLYAVFAPHSVAASSNGIAISTIGWLIRSVGAGSFKLRRSNFDLVILLSILWTLLTALLSQEPHISILKTESLWCVLIFYLTRAVLNRRWALILAGLLILSASAGVLYGLFDLARGRGVVVASLMPDSPLRSAQLEPGDTVWRVAGKRIDSKEELDNALRSLQPGTPFSISIISRGEHVERERLTISKEQQNTESPSGIFGNERNHHFRASGWTRHYETFAELLQLIAQLALGIALAHFRNHGFNKYARVALCATGLLAVGIALTAMRTVLVAFVLAASLVAFRALRGLPRVVFTFALFFVLAFGAVVVWNTRASNALLLSDPSSSLRYQVARVGLSRIMVHPIFGHGMDAMKMHWTEWGFPGSNMLHLHSTPLQLAFDRGLPMLLLWGWMMLAFWWQTAKAEKNARDRSDTNAYGLLLGVLGALTGMLISSLVNYNYGDAEVVMLFWFLMGTALLLKDRQTQPT